MRGFIHIYEGNGKGKTTAGIGLSVRCAGSGQKVLYAQFLKDNSSSELKALEQIEGISVVYCEQKCGYLCRMTPEERVKMKKIYHDFFRRVAQKAVEDGYRLLVLDELIDAYNLDMVDHKEVLDFLKNRPEELEIVLTGRKPREELLDLADYISHIQKIRHPYDQGIPARIGIEL